MISYSGYYYKDIWVDTAPEGQSLFVICAGFHMPVTLPFLDNSHPLRNDYQLLYVKNGRLYYDDDEGVEQVAEKNSFVIFYPKEWQSYRFYLKDQSEIYWVHFSGEFAKSFLKEQGIFGKRCVQVAESERYSIIFRNIIDELQQKKPRFEELCVLSLKELVISLSRDSLQKKGEAKKSIPPETEQVIRFIEEHYYEEIYLDELAKEHYMSKSWLIRQFNEHLGLSPMKYLNKIRVEKAAQLLQSTNSVGDIAKAVGFSDQLYFSKVFKARMGMSPENYRKYIK